MTTDSIRGSRSLRWNINVPAREHQRSNGGTSMFQRGNIDIPAWEHGRSSAGTLLIALRRKATGSLL